MGFLDKLKSAKNALTGGAAKVYVEVGEVVRGQPTPVVVRAVAQSDGNVNAVYLLIRAQEEARVEDVDVSRDGQVHREAVFGRFPTYDTRVELAGAGTLTAGEEIVFEGEIVLPEHLLPTLQGQLIRHSWSLQAGLDMFGNDPDSGWIEFHVA